VLGQFKLIEASKPIFGKFVPRFELFKVTGKALESVWKQKEEEIEPFKIPMHHLTDDTCDQPLRIVLWNCHKEKQTVHGLYNTTLSNLKQASAPSRLVDVKGKSAGLFTIASFSLVREPTICDYMKSELQIDLHVAIDFTSSNKDPYSPLSLHYQHDDKFNPYEACLNAFCALLAAYNFNDQFAVYGFGGKVHGFEGNYFPLTFDPRNPRVRGFAGIVSAYRSSLSKIQLSHPTIFSDIIEMIRTPQNERFKSGNFYGVLVVLVDDEVSDYQKTVDEIIMSSAQALSIVIIGIGPADFTRMEKFNDYRDLKSSQGRYMERKNVVFVWLDKMLKAAGDKGLRQVAAWGLIDIPTQVTEFGKASEFQINLIGD
jgi:hypothetical protein